MLFAPFGALSQLPLSCPFCWSRTLSPKDIAGCNIMKLKVSQHIYASLVGKGLKLPIMPHTFLYYAPVMLISSFQYCVVLTRLSSVLLFCQSSSEWDGLVVSLVSILVGISSSMLLLAPHSYSSLPHLTRCPSPSCDSCPSREWITKLLHMLFCGPNRRTPPISRQFSSYYAGIMLDASCSQLLC